MNQEALEDDPAKTWDQISPILDELVGALSTADRQAILLRFYQQKSMADVGAAMNVSEEAAKKRVAKSLEKLRSLIRRKGVTVTTAILASSALSFTTHSANATLVSQCAVASSGGISSVAAVSIAKGALTTMFTAKLKFAAIILFVFAILPVGGIGTYLLHADSARVVTASSTTAPSAPHAATTLPSASPNGTWIAVSTQFNGADAVELQDSKCAISDNFLSLINAHMQVNAAASFHPSTNPPSFETINHGQTCHGIYQFNGDTLVLCLAMPGLPRPTDFTTPPGDYRYLISFKRVGNATTLASPTTQGSTSAIRVACAKNLHEIGQGILMYRHTHNDNYPPDLRTLLDTMRMVPATFVCPGTGKTVPSAMTRDEAQLWANQNSDYEYLGASIAHLASHPDLVVAYDKDDNNHGDGGMNLLFVDGHVEWLKLDVAHALIEKTKALQEP